MVKNGRRGAYQRYYCRDCNLYFTGGKPKPNKDHIWHLYQSGLTYQGISEEVGVSVSTVKRIVRTVASSFQPAQLAQGVVQIDVTYWGRNSGILVALDAFSKRIIYRKWIAHETGRDYAEALRSIEEQGYKIQAVIGDGGAGFLVAKKLYPFQMCQFHFAKIIRKKLTLKPKIEASRELLRLSRALFSKSKVEFTNELNSWLSKWDEFLKEKTISEETGRWQYTHKSLRSAVHSFKEYLPYLFTYEDYPSLPIANTNNALEGLFTGLKNALGKHNGMSRTNRERFVDEFFRHRDIVQLSDPKKEHEE